MATTLTPNACARNPDARPTAEEVCDELARWLREEGSGDQWGSACDFIEHAAGLLFSLGHKVEPELPPDQWETLEGCECGECFYCPDGYHAGPPEHGPCCCTPDCIRQDDDEDDDEDEE